MALRQSHNSFCAGIPRLHRSPILRTHSRYQPPSGGKSDGKRPFLSAPSDPVSQLDGILCHERIFFLRTFLPRNSHIPAVAFSFFPDPLGATAGAENAEHRMWALLTLGAFGKDNLRHCAIFQTLTAYTCAGSLKTVVRSGTILSMVNNMMENIPGIITLAAPCIANS